MCQTTPLTTSLAFLQPYDRSLLGVLAQEECTATAFIRGGNWNNGSNAGAFTLNVNNAPTNTNTNIGFRVARYYL